MGLPVRLGLGVIGVALAFAAPAGATTYFTTAPASGTANPITANSSVTNTASALAAATVYATQAVASSSDGGSVTIPAGLAVSILSTDATVAESNGRLTLTLPAGVKVTSVPTANIVISSSSSVTSTTTALPVVAVGPGAVAPAGNGLVINLTAGVAKKNTITVIQLGSFTISGASSLSTPQASLPFTIGVSGFSANAAVLNDSKVIEGVLATSSSGVTGALTIGPGDSIAVTSSAIATRFNARDVAVATGATTSPTVLSTVANLGSVTVASSAAVNATAAAAQYTTSATGTLTIKGVFSNYASAWLSSSATCTTTSAPSGALPATLSNTALTIPNVPLSGNTQAICVTGSGSTVLSPTGAVIATFTIDGQTQVLSAPSPVSLDYAGSTFRVPFVTAKTGASQGYFRLVNTTTQTAPIYAIVRSDDGRVFSGQIAVIGPLTSQLVTHDAVLASLGATSAFASGVRGIANLFASQPALGSAVPGLSSGNASGVSVTSLAVTSTGLASNLY